MKMSQAHIRPGRVLRLVDENGTIKAACCGLFSDQDEPDKLPPVYQFPLGNSNSFYSMHEDDEIWILFFDDNPLELFYIRKDILPENLKDILAQKYEDVEVIASREMPAGFVQIYFTDGDGWIIRNIDSFIQLRKDGSILLDSGSAHRKIDICNDSISIGSEGGSAHTAALGDKVVESLNKLDALLTALEKAAAASPYTAALGSVLSTIRPAWASTIASIESTNVTLD
jgi:hypothetical protein